MYRYGFTISRLDEKGRVVEAVYSIASSDHEMPMDALYAARKAIDTQMEIEGAKYHAANKWAIGADLADISPGAIAGAMEAATLIETGPTHKVVPWLHGDRAHASGLDHAPVPLPRRERGANYRPQSLADLPTFTKEELKLIREDDPASIRMQELQEQTEVAPAKVEVLRVPVDSGEEPPQGCICNAINNPPCGFCEQGGQDEDAEKLRDV